MTMTRAEAEANERRYGRTCRGPRNQDFPNVLEQLLQEGPKDRPLRAGTAPAAKAGGDPAEWPLSALRETLTGLVQSGVKSTDGAIAWLLEQGLRRAAGELDAATRAGCGYDVNETICANPFDGQEREEPCPKCGLVRTYRAPVYPGLHE